MKSVARFSYCSPLLYSRNMKNISWKLLSIKVETEFPNYYHYFVKKETCAAENYLSLFPLPKLDKLPKC